MKGVTGWLRNNPTRAVALLALVVTSAAAYLPAAVGQFLAAALAIVIGKPLYDVVTPVGKVTQMLDKPLDVVNGVLKGIKLGGE